MAEPSRCCISQKKLLWAAGAALLLLPLFLVSPALDIARGWLQSESFYHNRPTSFWAREVKRWAAQRTEESVAASNLLLQMRIAVKAGDFSRPDVLSGDDSTLPMLLELSRHGDVLVRQSVTRALGTLTSVPAATQALRESLDDDDRGVRLLAAKGLDRDGEGELADLAHGLQNADWVVRLRVLGYLERRGPLARPALPGVRACLGDVDRYVQLKAAFVLWRLDGRDPMAEFQAGLQDENVSVHNAAARFVGELGPRARAAIPALQALAASPTAGVRESAIAALRRIQTDQDPSITK